MTEEEKEPILQQQVTELDASEAIRLMWESLEDYDNLNQEDSEGGPDLFLDLDLESAPLRMQDTVQNLISQSSDYNIKDLPICVRHAVLAAAINQDPDSWNLYCYLKMSQNTKKNAEVKMNDIYYQVDNQDFDDYMAHRIESMEYEEHYYPDEINEIELSLREKKKNDFGYDQLSQFAVASSSEFYVKVADNSEYRSAYSDLLKKFVKFRNPNTINDDAQRALNMIGIAARTDAEASPNKRNEELHKIYGKNGLDHYRTSKGTPQRDNKFMTQRLVYTKSVTAYLRKRHVKYRIAEEGKSRYLEWPGMASKKIPCAEFVSTKHLRNAMRVNYSVKFRIFKFMSKSDVTAAIKILNARDMPFIFSFRNYYILLCCDSVVFFRLFIAHEIRRKQHRPILDFDYAQRIKHYLKKNPDHDITNWLNGKNLDGSDFCDKYKGLLKHVEETQNRSFLKITNKMPFEHPKKCRLACHCVSVDTNDLLKAGVLTTLYNGKIKMREEASRCMFCRTLYYGVCDNKDHFKNRNIYIKKLKDYYGFNNSNVDLHKDCYPVLTAGDKLAWLYGNVFSVTQSDLEGLAIEMLFDYDVIQTDIEKERFPEHYRDRLFPITIRCEDCTNFTKKALIIRETGDLIPVEDVIMRITGDLHLAQYPQRDDLIGDGPYEEDLFGRAEDFVYRPVSPVIVENLSLTYTLQDDVDVRGQKRKNPE